MHVPFVALSCLIGCSSAIAAESRPASSPSLQAQSGASAVTCALLADSGLGLADSPLVALLEVRLSEHPGIRLVERREVEKVLAEQKLAFSGQIAAAELIQVGQLLRADLLVLLRTHEAENARLLQITFAETKHGFRLGRQILLREGDVEQSAIGIAQMVNMYAHRAQEGFRYVCAVPPFQSDDLMYDVGQLKKSLAQTLQAILAREPGLMLAELEHAREIAKELAVSTGSSGLARPLPWYIRGMYRHSEPGRNDLLDLALELYRGEERIAAVENQRVAPEAILASLRAAASAFCGLMTGGSLPALATRPAEENAEAELLEQQVLAFEEAGDWQEVIELSEAALLLAPSRARMHLHVLKAAGFLMRDRGIRDERSTASWDLMRFSRHVPPRERRYYALLGLDHLATYLQQALLPRDSGLSAFWLESELPNYSWTRDPDQLTDLQRRICLQKKAIILQILNQNRLAPDYPLSGFAYNELTIEFTHTQYSPLTVQERQEGLYEVLVALGRYPRSIREQWAVLSNGFATNAARDEAFLTRLASRAELGPLVALARAVEQGRRSRDPAAGSAFDAILPQFGDSPVEREWFISRLIYEMGPARVWPPAPPSSRPADAPLFTPLPLVKSPNWFTSKPCHGWINCRPGLETIYSADRLLIMRTQGTLESLPLKVTEEAREICHVTYDGRFLWVAMRGQDQHVRIFDPDAGTLVGTLNAAEGLPPTTAGAALAPLAPGRVCMAGGFGRGWVANLAFEPESGSAQVDVFFEARRLSDPGPYKSEPDIAFRPLRLQSFGTPGGKRLLLLSRAHAVSHRTLQPLVFDPSSRQLLDVPEADILNQAIASNNGYYARLVTRRGWYFCQLPDLKPKKLPGFDTLSTNTYVHDRVLENGRLHGLGWQWMITDFNRGEMIELPLSDPGKYGWSGITRSAAYGWVAYGNHGAWQVRLPDGY